MTVSSSPSGSTGVNPELATRYGRVVVLFGGLSAEREVSLKSGAAVLAALQGAGVDVQGYDMAHGLAGLEALRPDRVFIAMHGRGGEDGTLQGALELLGIPYTGSGVLASALGMDKLRTKKLWDIEGLPTPRCCRLAADTDWQSVLETLGTPVVVKPVHEGSTLGIHIVEDAQALQDAWTDASRFDAVVMAERFVKGPEYTVSVLDGEVLPAIRIEADSGFYDYDAKYIANTTRYLLPCGLSAAREAELAEISLKAFNVLGCEGWGRVDVMEDADGAFWLLEVNTSPGMTDHSLVPQSAAHVGLDFATLVLRILDTTLAERDANDASVAQQSGH